MPDGSLANAKLNGSYEQFSFLPGLPGGLPSIRFDSIDDGTGFWYDPDTKSVKLRFAGTDVYTFDDAGGLTMTVVTLQANGTAAAPSYSFASSSNDGMYLISGHVVAVAINGNATWAWRGANVVEAGTSTSIGWSSSSAGAGTSDTTLYRDSADTIGQRRGASAQTFRIYNTYTDASNYERGVLDWSTSSNNFLIGTQALGTGVGRNVVLMRSGVAYFTLGNSVLTATQPVQAAAGAVGAPSYSFSGATNVGMWLNGSSVTFSDNGTFITEFSTSGGVGLDGIRINNNYVVGFSSSANAAPDALFLRDGAADTIAMRRTTNAQTFRIYNTYTDASNYERLEIGANVGGVGANTFGVLANNAGTGSNRDLYIGTVTSAALKFRVGGTDRFQMSGSTGHLIPTADVTYDFGGTSNFVKDVYARRRVNKVATITYSASMTPDAALGEIQQITVTNATAHTINAPTNPLTGQHLRIQIRNTSGGALGVATWNAVFKMSAWTQPANANSRSIEFFYDGTNWIEHDRTTVDVPN